ncbi:MAG: uracil phosphoribosyltransferase [Bacteroidales bacterium]|jgi:uracil phosphoribosyltransferase|nr:uracil phosphoribosyltransferase [Bacteroidales bacterium]
MVKILGKSNSILNQFIAEIRDKNIQKDSMRFRRNFERIGEIFAYEISKQLAYETREVTTPLGVAEVPVLISFPVLATILRAGLPLHQGLLNFFDHSENAFISAYRYHYKDGQFDIRVEYTSSPELTDKVLILSDPMLATGASLVLTHKSLLENGKPSHTHIVTIVASTQGVEYIKKNFSSKNTTLWIGALDDELTAQAYIVPGLGDAGDLAYGIKI